MKTPKTDKKQSEAAEKEKTSGKKLVQARLPFKILSTPTGGDSTTRNDSENDSSETRKRKLSYDNDDVSQVTKKKSVKNENDNNVDKSKNGSNATEVSSKPTDVVLLSDSDVDNDCNVSCSKENLKTSNKIAKILKEKLFESDHEADMHSDDVELIESTDDDVTKVVTVTSEKPMPAKKTNLNNSKNDKKITTPKSVGKSNVKGKKIVDENLSEHPKVLIKLPVSAKKTRRRKTSIKQIENAEQMGDAEDIEPASPVSQPQKRAKLEEDKLKKQDRIDDLFKVVEVKKLLKDAGVVQQEEIVRVVKSVKDAENLEKSEVCTPKVKNKNDESLRKKNSQKTTKIQEQDKCHNEVSSKEKYIIKVEKGIADKTENIEPETTHVDLNKKASPEKSIKNIAKAQAPSENVVKLAADQTKNVDSKNKQVDLEEKASPAKSAHSTSQASEEELTTESDTNKSKIQEQSSSSTDIEADAETETTIKNEQHKQSEVNGGSSVETPVTPKISNESTSQKLHKKNLTPKQQKLLEQRLKAREEKERKIQEERIQKQREKEERELAKKREREEKDEQKRKEREEKEEQRRKEREEKERKRLAELEMKNEEKRKRNEAKEEESRKKEEDRKRKEQEKEEAELKKKKAAMAFTKFFSRPTNANADQKCETQAADKHNQDIILAFRPFQVKGAMKLAPTVRKQLTNEALTTLDAALAENEAIVEEKLYVKQLKAGEINPQKWIRPAQKDVEETKLASEVDDDVIIVEDELERAGLAIVEEPVAPVERLRVKFFKFAGNRRPPYYGTWRKKSQTITPRKPFAQDKKYFDYEIDSDDEWEEEEPGESLDGSDDEKEKESEDEDYEVDNEWFVPHGHLSEEELQGEDDLGENNDREAQKAKLQILQKEFAQEMKKKTEKIKPRLIGCIWVDENGNQPELCPKIIWDTLNSRAILCAEPPLLEEIDANSEKNSEVNAANAQANEKSNGEIKLKPITLNAEMLKKLVRLVHGNTHSKNFMIKEFIAYIEANEESVRNGDVKVPLKSAIREKIDEYAQWQVIENISNDNNDNVSSAKKKKNKKKLCWVVSEEKLKEMEMENLDLNNNWQYTLEPREKRSKAKTESTSVAAVAQGEDSNEHSEASVEQTTGSPSTKIKPKADIKKFTKVLTAAEKAQQLEKSRESVKTTTNIKPTTPSTAKTNSVNNNNNNNTTATVKKRVPLLMSVARGQNISTPDKNARISQFLKNLNDAKQKEKSTNDEKSVAQPIPMDVDEVVVLD